jgi:hypothetical protein
MTLLDRATKRGTTRKASAPMRPHLNLPSNMRQVDKAYKRQQVYQACSKSLRFFWDRHWKLQHWKKARERKYLILAYTNLQP